MYPQAYCGVVAFRNVRNPAEHIGLEERKDELRRELITRYSDRTREDLKCIDEIRAYVRYYRNFKKTYHVLLQLETVVLKGRDLPPTSALVKTMFMVELKNLLLTAAHDLDALIPPLKIDVSEGNESYVLLNGAEQVLKSGDMMIADGDGVISSIIYGPDSRSRITSETRNALYTVYAPQGIGEDQVRNHMRDIEDYVSLFSSDAETAFCEVFGGGTL
jgi:DNA/RNA-binding domain of Phe-tRNA-synthetase-like protein